MSVPKRDPSLQIMLLSLTIPPVPSGKYGASFGGHNPAVVNDVVAGSIAEQGGLRQADFIVKINGTDVTKRDADDIVSLLNQLKGRKLSVCVARPRPVPTTDAEKRRALLVVQNKLDSKAIDSKLEQAKYASALSGAQQLTQGVIEALKTSDDEPEEQVVLLEVYDNDSLASPPDSSGEEEEEEAGKANRVNFDDTLLDFSRNDSLNHFPKKWGEDTIDTADSQAPVDTSSPSKHPKAEHESSPTKTTHSFAPASQSTASGSRAHPPVMHTMSDIPVGSKASSDVVLRQRKRDGLAGTGTSAAQLNQKSIAEVEIQNVAGLDVACRALPSCVREWSCSDVQAWLKQLNETLHMLYSTNFADHEITGPSLLRLNEDRLTDMGIKLPKHRYLLASLIATLRVKQESLEIRELVATEDVDTDNEELEMTYL